jgi:hypothetical protein
VEREAEELRLGVLLLDGGQPVLGGQDDVDAGEPAVVLGGAVEDRRPAAPDAEQDRGGLPVNSSWSRLAVLATQLSSVVAESSTRSPVESS